MNKKLCVIFALLISQTFCYISKELYEEIKSKAAFEVLDYQVVREIFAGRTYEDFSFWKGENHLVSEEMKAKLAETKQMNFLEADLTLKALGLPAEYDLRKEKPECLTPVKDQKYCGSCYSFSVAAALESRFCVQSQGKVKPELSQEDIVSCDPNNHKCHGDRLDNTWKFVETVGTCSHFCKPYSSGLAKGVVPTCQNQCSAVGFTYQKWKAKLGSWRYFNRIDQIKAEVYQYGPVSAGMVTYEDFSTYKSGIYIHTTGKQTDHHAVVIIGWGYDTTYKREYWIVRNSWGAHWGEGGYFKILMGMYEIDSFTNVSDPLI